MTLWASQHVIKVDAYFLRCAFCKRDITGLKRSSTDAVDAAEAAEAVILKLPGQRDDRPGSTNFLACVDCKKRDLLDFQERDDD